MIKVNQIYTNTFTGKQYVVTDFSPVSGVARVQQLRWEGTPPDLKPFGDKTLVPVSKLESCDWILWEDVDEENLMLADVYDEIERKEKEEALNCAKCEAYERIMRGVAKKMATMSREIITSIDGE